MNTIKAVCGRYKGDVTRLLFLQTSVQAWIRFQKKKWMFQQQQRSSSTKRVRRDGPDRAGIGPGQGEAGRVVRAGGATTLGGFLRRAQRTLMDVPWQIIQASTTPMRHPG